MSRQAPSLPPAGSGPAVTLRDAAAFFLPLIFMAEMMMITHTVIHAWLAREELSTVTLAGFSIAFALTGLQASAFRALHQIALSFITDRRSIRRVWNFGMVISLANMVFMVAVSRTALGDWVYGGLLGAGAEAVREARAASLVFALIFPFQVTRNVAAGLLMVNRHTLLITYGTLLRLISLGGFLVGFSAAIHGAPLGAAALVGCIGVESVFVAFFARPYYLARPAAQGVLPGYGEIGRFAWPVIANAMLENGLVVVINGFVGRLANPDLSLAAFGVTRGLLMLMMSPLRNLAQTAQALARSEADLRVVWRFAALAGTAYTALIGVLFYTPLRGVLLGSVMGLEPLLVRATEPAVLLFAITPFLWAFASLYRGLLAGAKRTGVLATSGLVRLATVIAVSSVCLVLPQVNGAVVGVLAMAAAFASEMVLLRLSLHRHVQAGRAYRSDIRPTPKSESGTEGVHAG